MIRKILTLILAISMLMSSVAFAEESTEIELYDKEISFLTTIGLFTSGSFEPDAPVTRGDFAELLVKLYYNDISSNEAYQSSFSDVSTDSKYCFAVALLEDLKVVNGNSAHTFAPESQILMSDAVVMLIRLLGYDLYAKEMGGYIAGYVSAANKIQLTKGVKWSNKGLDYNTAAKLLYNSLFVSSVDLDYVSEEGPVAEIKHGETFLSERLGITVMDAYLIHDGVRSYNNEGVLENLVVLKDVKTGVEKQVYNTDSSVCDLFGYKVEAYIRKDEKTEREELIYIRAHKDNIVTKIHSDDIVTSTTSYVEYEVDDGLKTQKIKFDVDNLYAFVNGYKLEGYSSSDFNPYYGEITYIDNTGDKNADVILIDKIDKQIVVSGAPTADKRIICKASAANSLDFSDNDIIVRVYKNGLMVDMAELTDNDVVSVAYAEKAFKDGKTLVILYASSKVTSGVLNEVSDNKLIVIDEAEFMVSNYLTASKPNLFALIKTNLTYTTRLDSYGRIAHIDQLPVNNIEFCYLLNVKQLNPHSDLKLYIFTRNCTLNELIVSDKVVIDGVTISALSGNFKDNVINALSKRYNSDSGIEEIYKLTASEAAAYDKSHTAIVPRPAIIKVNTKGEVYFIDTDFPTHSDEKMEEEDVYALKAGTRIYRNLMLRTHQNNGNPSSVDGTFFVTDDTLILNVADIDRYNMPAEHNTEYTNLYEGDISDINNYKVIAHINMNHADKYDLQVYNVDDATGVAEFAIVRGLTRLNHTITDTSYDTNFVIFKNLTKIVDNTGSNEEKYKLYYMDGDITDSVIVSKSKLDKAFVNLIFGDEIKSSAGNVLYPKTDGLSQGDLILIDANQGEVVGIRRQIDLSKINDRPLTTAIAENPVSYYADQGGVVVYDNFPGGRAHFNDGSYVHQLAVPVKGIGSFFKIMQPLNSTGTEGTLSSYYTDGLGVYGAKESYIGVASAGFASTVVVEEIKHSDDGKCVFRVKNGTTSDIKYMDSYGFFDASRVYVNYISGDPQRLFIFNLLPEHNGKR